MASLGASSAIAAISSQGFLGGKKLRLKKKLSVPAVSRSAASVRAVAADPDRPIWFPGSTPPEWLDGSLPGDFGFDPLGLSSDPDSLKWNAQAVRIRRIYDEDLPFTA
ncbi:photosystem I chlorophyll a/b-binding protein 2, chloroplastic [Brassica napus]|uniref:Chlorophyll a-b binding protein, chloroplastic n=1 Tax=Brassica carinata TaxID=52824 RepID=A0A8X7PV70_BRACI|nr:photosystem I chlorophyll a/b-binding protein 2, chloroplastic [Brassica napus]KAG2258821.1 hypothetical protein Bca52824_078115 [Brassica carinata]